MGTLWVEKAEGAMMEQNSMLEKDLSQPIDLSQLYSTCKEAQVKPEIRMEIPKYMDQDFDPETSALAQYLKEVSK